MTIGLILGSAYHDARPLGLELAPRSITTPHGDMQLHQVVDRDAVALFRHGLPHCWLPHQIPYRAHASALVRVGVTSLVVTSSVGVLDPDIPLHEPLLVDDLIMLDNRADRGVARDHRPRRSRLDRRARTRAWPAISRTGTLRHGRPLGALGVARRRTAVSDRLGIRARRQSSAGHRPSRRTRSAPARSSASVVISLPHIARRSPTTSPARWSHRRPCERPSSMLAARSWRVCSDHFESGFYTTRWLQTTR